MFHAQDCCFHLWVLKKSVRTRFLPRVGFG
jgi:hypothetical protein